MNININFVNFKKIKAGGAFMHENHVFIKTERGDAVCLEDGWTVGANRCDCWLCLPLEAEVCFKLKQTE